VPAGDEYAHVSTSSCSSCDWKLINWPPWLMQKVEALLYANSPVLKVKVALVEEE
jgi:hypothetical protein